VGALEELWEPLEGFESLRMLVETVEQVLLAVVDELEKGVLLQASAH